MVVHLSHDWACDSGRGHHPTSCGDATLKSNWGLGSCNGNDHWQHEVQDWGRLGLNGWACGEGGVEWCNSD